MIKLKKRLTLIPSRVYLLVLLMMVTVSMVVVSGTFATFQTTVIGIGESPVSEWDFKVKINGNTTEDDSGSDNSLVEGVKLAGDESELHKYNRDAATELGAYKLAAGTSGYMPVEIDGSNSQVSIQVTVTAYFGNLPSTFVFYNNLGEELSIMKNVSGFTPTGTVDSDVTFSSVSYSYYISYQEITEWAASTLSNKYINVGFRWAWIDNSQSEDYDGDNLYTEIRVTGRQITHANQINEDAKIVNFVDDGSELIKNNGNVLNILTKSIGSTNLVLEDDFYLDTNKQEDNISPASTFTVSVKSGSEANVENVVLGTTRRETADYVADESTRPVVRMNLPKVMGVISNDFTYKLLDSDSTKIVCCANINAKTLASNLNDILVDHDGSTTLYDAFKTIINNKSADYIKNFNKTTIDDLASLMNTTSAYSDDVLVVWNSNTNRFIYINDGKEVPIKNYAAANLNVKNDFFKVYTVDSSTTDVTPADLGITEQTYSIYIVGTLATGTKITGLTTGLDVGTFTNISKVKYERPVTASAQSVLVRTGSFDTIFEVDAITDTVKHYGYACQVYVANVASSSYHENGTVGRLAVENGHTVAEPTAEIFCYMDVSKKDTTNEAKTTLKEEEGSKIHHDSSDAATEIKLNEELDNYKGKTDDGTVKDCGAGNHKYGQKIVIDSVTVYEVCTCCGYALVTVKDNQDTVIKQTKNDIDVATGEVLEEVTTPIETYLTTVEIPTTPESWEEFNETAVNVPLDGNDGEPIVEAIVFDKVDEPAPESEIVATCKHDLEEKVVVVPTCVTKGRNDYICKTCGQTIYSCELPINPKHHEWGTTSSVYLSGNATYGYSFTNRFICKCGKGVITDAELIKYLNVTSINDTSYVSKRVKYLNNAPADVTYSNNLTYSNSSEFSGIENYGTVFVLQDCTDIGLMSYTGTWAFDLNGHTITDEKSEPGVGDELGANGTAAILYFQNAGQGGAINVTIKDSVGTGKVKNTATSGNYRAAVDIRGQAGGSKLTIDGGTFEATLDALYFEGGDITINNGTFVGQNAVRMNAYKQYSAYTRKITINGGTFDGKMVLYNQSSAPTEEYQKGTVIINGGTFNDVFEVGDNFYLTINGGKFKYPTNLSDYLAAGKYLVEEDGYFVVKSAPIDEGVKAIIDEKVFVTSSADYAIQYAGVEETVKLYEDATYALTFDAEGESIIIVANGCTYVAPVASAGFTLKTTEIETGKIRYEIPVIKNFAVNHSGTITEYDTFDQAKAVLQSGDTFYLQKDVTVSSQLYLGVRGVTFDFRGHTITSTYGSAMFAYAFVVHTSGGTVTIKDTVGGGGINAKKIALGKGTSTGAKGVLYIYGGTFKSTESYAYDHTYGHTYIYGGKFIGSSSSKILSVGSAIAGQYQSFNIQAGTYNGDITSFVDGTKVKYTSTTLSCQSNGDGTWTVK